MKRRNKTGGTPRRDAGLKVWHRMPRAGSRRGSRHLFDRWARVAERLRAAKQIALFLDFDGTLVPLRHRPDNVWLDAAARHAVERLARHRHVTVCLISGRRLADLRRRAGIPGVRYLGLYGWECDGRPHRTRGTTLLKHAKESGSERLRDLKGIWVEDKEFSFAVHYRGARASDARRAGVHLRKSLEPFAGQLRILSGKKVWEVLPAEVAGKGQAARGVLAELGGTALPLYLGDDTTDEAAFEVLRGGITIRVGPARRTRARYRLRNPQEVWDFLARLEDEIL